MVVGASATASLIVDGLIFALASRRRGVAKNVEKYQHIIHFFSSFQDDRASVFPHGRNLNLLILVVVGASATASLIVGGLIFALASRRRGVAKNVSKLQLSDDIEESGKLEQQQEGYKVLIILLSKVF